MIYLALLFSLWFVMPAVAHDAPLDPYGCHSDKALFGTSAKRECHQGLLAGQVFSSTTAEYIAYIAAQKALLTAQSTTFTIQAAQITDLQTKLAACQAQCPAVSTIGQVALSWLANAEPDMAGYKAYCGTQSHVYALSKDVGPALTWTFMGLQGGRTWYCAVTAYDQAKNESAFSQEVTKVLP